MLPAVLAVAIALVAAVGFAVSSHADNNTSGGTETTTPVVTSPVVTETPATSTPVVTAPPVTSPPRNTSAYGTTSVKPSSRGTTTQSANTVSGTPTQVDGGASIDPNQTLDNPNAGGATTQQIVSSASSETKAAVAQPFDLLTTLKNWAFIPIILIIAALYLIISENLKAHNRRKAEKAREARMNSMMGSSVNRRRK